MTNDGCLMTNIKNKKWIEDLQKGFRMRSADSSPHAGWIINDNILFTRGRG